MRSVLISIPLLAPLVHGELIARFETDKGIIDTVLEYETAPMAVANFMTLAQGTRSRVDPNTGAVTNRPLYIGETFFRTVNSSQFKFAQTGSGSGDNTGNSGFTFKDEFTGEVRHTGYTLSSANAGPNTNNGQIFFTGDIAIPSYDDVHAIIGLVVDEASQSVVDQVIESGNNGSTILNVSFLRTDPAAEAFDELAQGLPTVTAPAGWLEVSAGESAEYLLETSAGNGDLLRVSASTDLDSWSEINEVGVGLDDPPVTTMPLDDASAPTRFYHLSKASHPDSAAPSGYAERVLVLTYDGGETHTYTFNQDGTGGALQITTSNQALNGSFAVSEILPNAYSGIIAVNTSFVLGDSPFNPVLRCGWESTEPDAIIGRHRTTLFGGLYGSGPASVSR